MKAKTTKKKTLKKPLIAVGIGASAGGTIALKAFFAGLQTAPETAYIVVQHTDSAGRFLALDVLKKLTDLPVVEVTEGTRLAAQTVHLAPPHSMLNLEDGVFSLQFADTREQSLTTIDSFFKSLAHDFTMKSVGIILSGEGSDGTQGVKAISDQGGMTIAQDPQSSEHQAMPQSAIATGIIDHTLKASDIGAQLQSYEDYIRNVIEGDGLHSLRDRIGLSLNVICGVLHRETNHDFKHYKTTTLIRRIQRRMQVLQLDSVDDYVQKLEKHTQEVDALFKELLINVTSFFRDPDAFETLREQVISPALKKVPKDQKFRVWVAGCSSGEEVYTLAMMIREELDLIDGKKPEIQIIATDIDEAALNQARKGSYSLSIASSMTPERLAKFFQKRAGRYHINKEVREMCLFSAHNLINDPPFSQLDLITCRNVLIYLGLHLQKKLIPVFHYALKPGGYLFLGNSESLSSHKELFKTVSAKHRIAQRKATSIRPGTTFAAAMAQNFHPHPHETQRNHEADIHLVSQRIVLDEFAPRYAVVNEDFQIVSVSAGIHPYLDPVEGTFHNNIVKMVRASLRVSLRATLNEAKKHKRKMDSESASLKYEDGLRRVGITVQPMPQLGDESGLFMVVFHKLNKVDMEVRVPTNDKNQDHSELIDQLERELSILREDLEKSVQDLEASNEELKSSNEELLSMNEELQSANEELETSKEDVQEASDLLQRSHNDLENLLDSTDIATVFLNENLQIQSFTPALEDIYNIAQSDIGRPISHFTHLAKEMPDYPSAKEIAAKKTVIENHIQLLNGRFVLRRISPYKTPEGTFNGIVVTFIDVTSLHLAEDKQRESENRFAIMADNAPVLVWISNTEKVSTWFNKGWLNFTGRTLEQECGNGWAEGVHPDDLDRCLKTYASKFDARKEFYMEYRLRHHSGEYRWLSENGVPRYTPDGQFEGFIGACMDIHEQRIATEKLSENEHRLNLMFETSPAFMAVLNGPEYTFEQVNPQFQKLVGHRDITGKSLKEALPEISSQGFVDLLAEVRRTGIPYIGKEAPVSLLRTPGAKEEVRFLDFVYQPDRSAENKQGRIFVHGNDVTEKVQARQSIENERENFRNLFRQTPEMVCMLYGPEHTFEFVNEAHIRALGFDATGKTVRQAQPESVEVHTLLDEVYRTGITADLPEIPITLGDRLRYFNLTYAARRGLDGAVNGVMILGNEITDQLLGREVIHSQKRALEATLQGAAMEQVLSVITKMIEDQFGGGAIASVLLVDDKKERLLHGSARNLPKEFNDALHNLKIEAGAGPCASTAYSGEAIIVDDIATNPLWKEYRDIAGRSGIRACWSHPITSSGGEVLGIFSIYYRVTKKPSEFQSRLLALATRTVALVIERKRAQEQIETAKTNAEAASESKTRFLANMSHEIRTPLAAILGFSDLLQADHQLTQDASDYLQRISRNASHLGRLIDELLDLSKIEADKLEIEQTEFNLMSAIDDSISSVAHLAKEKNLPLKLKVAGDVPQKIISDQTRLRQILVNVIGNAVKFTDKGHVSVTLDTAGDNKNLLLVRVLDTGIGLSPEQRSALFKPFVQADNSITRKYGGTGLGLALSKKLAQLMGGDLVVEQSALNEGSSFVLTIKMESTESSSRKDFIKNTQKTGSEAPLAGKQILIVDDAPDNQTIIRIFITKAGGQVEIASNGQEALDKMKLKKYDLVLMDIQMPVLDGYQALQAAIASGYKAPIVAITAHAMKDEKIRCLQAGFKGYLSKPVNRADLIQKIVELTHG